jgi:hypothetical protein
LKNLILIITLLLSISLFSQNKAKIEDILIKIKSNYNQKNDQKVLQNVYQLYSIDTILPDESAFFLGYALYKFNHLEKSKNAFLRYIDLTKEQGNYFDSTVYFINKIDEKQKEYDTSYCDVCKQLGPLDETITCTKCTGVGFHTQNCTRCNGTGQEVCPRCLGVGYERYQDAFQNNFVPCQLCNRSGIIYCQKCDGNKTIKDMCSKCGGEGNTSKDRVCTHRNLENAVITPTKKSNSNFYR